MTAGSGSGSTGRSSEWRRAQEAPGPRLFLAVPVPSDVRTAIATLVDALPATTPPARWVRIDGLHLTLRFLGATTPDRAAAVADAAAALAAETPSFDLTIAGGGAFPSPARPRVLWLGIRTGTDALAALASGLEDQLAAAGWPREERRFRPHLTLARVDGLRSGPAVAGQLIAAAETFSAGFRVGRIALLQTVPTRGPARYEEVAGWPLQG